MSVRTFLLDPADLTGQARLGDWQTAADLALAAATAGDRGELAGAVRSMIAAEVRLAELAGVHLTARERLEACTRCPRIMVVPAGEYHDLCPACAA